MKAFSYQRFSTKAQEQGDSFRRQQKAFDDFLKKHPEYERGIVFRDAGKSAYSESERSGFENVKEAIKLGEIRSGDLLVVEALDRVSRAHPMKAIALIQEIVEHGIEILTLDDNQKYTKETDQSRFFLLVSKAVTAHEHSASISKRRGAAWAQMRATAPISDKLITPSTPFWLTSDQKIKEPHGELIKEAVNMRINGASYSKIANWAQTKHPELFKNKLRQTTVISWFRNRALIGELQTKKEGAIQAKARPALIDYTTWTKLQNSFTDKKKGYSTESKYFMNGFVKCKTCGGSCYIRKKASSEVVRLNGYSVYCEAYNSTRNNKQSICANKTTLPLYFVEYVASLLVCELLPLVAAKGRVNRMEEAEIDREIAEIDDELTSACDLINSLKAVPGYNKLQYLMKEMDATQAKIETLTLRKNDLIKSKDKSVLGSISENVKRMSLLNNSELRMLLKDNDFLLFAEGKSITYQAGQKSYRFSLINASRRDYFEVEFEVNSPNARTYHGNRKVNKYNLSETLGPGESSFHANHQLALSKRDNRFPTYEVESTKKESGDKEGAIINNN